MRNNVFIARLARGAVVSTMAACLMPQSHTDEATSPAVGHEAAFTGRTSTPDDGTQQGPEQAVTVAMSEAVSEWDKPMEREFRKLALEEAKGTLTVGQDKGSPLGTPNEGHNRNSLKLDLVSTKPAYAPFPALPQCMGFQARKKRPP